MILWSAFLVGIVGSMHCVGMCGPIALALPYQSSSRLSQVGNVLLYNFGRILTYAVLGILIGFFGQTFAVAGMQVYISIGIGVLLLLIALFSINVEHNLLQIPIVNRLNSWVKVTMARLLQQSKPSTLFSLGMLNGLLPCGLVYMAVIGAVATGSIWQGSAYMALFGLGTLPLMLTTALLGQFVPLHWRSRMRKLIPVFLVAFAILFLARGINFIMPDEVRFWEIGREAPMCH